MHFLLATDSPIAELIRWAGVVFVSFVVVHALKVIRDWVGMKLNLLEIIEIVVVVGLLYLTLEAYTFLHVGTSQGASWYEQPILLLAALLIFSIFSGVLWVFHRLIG